MSIQANQQVGPVGAAEDFAELAQDLRQGFRSRFAGSARAGRERRQADLFPGHRPFPDTHGTNLGPSIRPAFGRHKGQRGTAGG